MSLVRLFVEQGSVLLLFAVLIGAVAFVFGALWAGVAVLMRFQDDAAPIFDERQTIAGRPWWRA